MPEGSWRRLRATPCIIYLLSSNNTVALDTNRVYSEKMFYLCIVFTSDTYSNDKLLYMYVYSVTSKKEGERDDGEEETSVSTNEKALGAIKYREKRGR